MEAIFLTAHEHIVLRWKQLVALFGLELYIWSQSLQDVVVSEEGMLRHV